MRFGPWAGVRTAIWAPLDGASVDGDGLPAASVPAPGEEYRADDPLQERGDPDPGQTVSEGQPEQIGQRHAHAPRADRCHDQGEPGLPGATQRAPEYVRDPEERQLEHAHLQGDRSDRDGGLIGRPGY